MPKLLNSTIARILILVVLIGVGVAIWYLFVPRTVLYASGRGFYNLNNTNLINTKNFTTHGKWSVNYSYNCSSDAGDEGNFGYFVFDSQNLISEQDKDVNVTGSEATHTLHYTDKGNHFLQVMSSCPWSVVVKGSLISL